MCVAFLGRIDYGNGCCEQQYLCSYSSDKSQGAIKAPAGKHCTMYIQSTQYMGWASESKFDCHKLSISLGLLVAAYRQALQDNFPMKNSEVPLPELFVLCICHQQSKMDKKGFYHIYGQDKQPWMMTKFSTGPGAHNSVGVPLDWSGFTLEKLHSPSCSFGITITFATRSTPPVARFQWSSTCHWTSSWKS